MSSSSSSPPPPSAPSSAFTFLPSPFYPALGLKLQQVIVLSRHGERTPVRTRMADFFPTRWYLCSIGRQFDATVLETTGEAGPLPIKRLIDVPGKGTKAVGKEGECLLGELTDKGRSSTLALGQSLRKLYVDELGFLPAQPNPSDLYFRSTNMSRTVESLQQVIAGLYPAETRGQWRPEVNIRNMTEESLLPNTFACKRLAQLDKQFARAAALAWNESLKPLDKKISKYIGGQPVRVDGSPAASGIWDTVRAAEANGIKVPSDFQDPEVREVIENAICSEWFGGYTSKEVRTLAMGRLLSDLKTEMMDSISNSNSNKPAKKFLAFSCHDTSLAAVLGTLGVFDHKWPDFSAHLSFELFSTQPPTPSLWQSFLSPFWDSAPGPSHYVRLRYQGKPLALPACKKEGDHLPGAPELCALEAFTRAVLSITPTDWEAECEGRDVD